MRPPNDSARTPLQKSSSDAARWQRIARRIRVPLGFLTAALYLFELWRRAPQPAAVAWSLVLVASRSLAARLRRRIREEESRTHQTGPYAHTRNPLYLGSMLMAAGFAWRCSVGRSRWCWLSDLLRSMSLSSPRKSAFCARLSRISTTIAAAFRG